MLVDALESLWERQSGRQPAQLDTDLDYLRLFFDPLAQGGRLRELIANLPNIPPVRSRLLRPPLILDDGDEMLVTLEGRTALHELQIRLGSDSTNSDVLLIDPDTVCIAQSRVYRRYRAWSIRKLGSVLRLTAGKAEALRTPSLALLLLLLVNGSDSKETAFRRLGGARGLPDPNSPARLLDQTKLDAAIGDAVRAFCLALDAREREIRHFSLYSGYVVTEARRRLTGILGPEHDKLYVLPGQGERLVTRVAAELRRPKRSPETASVLGAFDRMVDAYRGQLPTLAALGMAHERRDHTRRIRAQLEDALNGDIRRARPA